MEENKVNLNLVTWICFFCDKSVKITIRLSKAWGRCIIAKLWLWLVSFPMSPGFINTLARQGQRGDIITLTGEPFESFCSRRSQRERRRIPRVFTCGKAGTVLKFKNEPSL